MFEKLFPVITAIVSMAVTFLFTIIRSNIQRRADFEIRLRYDAFQKRMALYEDIVNALSSMTAIENLPMNISIIDLSNKTFGYVHDLKFFYNRLSIFGSDAAVRLLNSISEDIQREPEDRPKNTMEAVYAASLRAAFCNTVRNALISFTELARKENGSVFIDKEILRWKSREKPVIKKLKERGGKGEGR